VFAGALGKDHLRFAPGSGTFLGMNISSIRTRARQLRHAAERAEDYDALELLDAVDDCLSGPAVMTPARLTDMLSFLTRIEESLGE
jgi:hypothetical protein